MHLFGHSLGSLIVSDMLMHQGKCWHGVRYPTFPFPVTNVYVCGSPAPLFFVARKQVTAVQAADAAEAAPPTEMPCRAFFNFVNSMDPVAHLFRPFLSRAEGERAPRADLFQPTSSQTCPRAV